MGRWLTCANGKHLLLVHRQISPTSSASKLTTFGNRLLAIENQLAAGEDEKSAESSARQSYTDAFQAEQAGDFKKALGHYKSAARYSHRDASQAMRSVRYKQKRRRQKTGTLWLPSNRRQANSRRLLWTIVAVIVILVIAFLVSGLVSPAAQQEVAAKATATATATLTPAIVQLIVPDTPTPLPTATLAPQPTSTPVPKIVVNNVTATEAPPPAATVTPVPTLRPAPQIIGPKDGLVWNDGAIVFEFEALNLAQDELYCLATMRGYDSTNTENWSYNPVGRQSSRLPIEANVFHVAKVQGMKCVVWSAFIGKGSCDNPISKTTVDRVIGMPRPCDF